MERLSILYASALFSLALERGKTGEYRDQAVLVRDTLKDPDVYRVLIHPHITDKEKHELFDKVFKKHINSDMLGFLYLVADKNRETYLLPALDKLIDNIDSYSGKVKAQVSTAAPYDSKQVKALSAMLSDKLGKQVDVEIEVNPDLIGGPYIYADGYYIDWSVKKRLHDMTRSMKEIPAKR